MAANGTESNSSEPACFLLGTFSWREEYLTPTNFILFIAAASTESVLIPFTVFFNVLVIFLVWRKRYLRKQKPCVLLACLAATDLLMGAVVLPLVVVSHIMRLVRAELICLQERIAVESIQIACAASLLHLAIISGGRRLRCHQVLLALRNPRHDASPDHSSRHGLGHFSRSRPQLTDKHCSHRRVCLYRDDFTGAHFCLHSWVCGYGLLLPSRCFLRKSTPSPRYPGSPGFRSRCQGIVKERQSSQNHDHGRWRPVVVLRPDGTLQCSDRNGSFANGNCCRGNLRHGGVHVC